VNSFLIPVFCFWFLVSCFLLQMFSAYSLNCFLFLVSSPRHSLKLLSRRQETGSSEALLLCLFLVYCFLCSVSCFLFFAFPPRYGLELLSPRTAGSRPSASLPAYSMSRSVLLSTFVLLTIQVSTTVCTVQMRFLLYRLYGTARSRPSASSPACSMSRSEPEPISTAETEEAPAPTQESAQVALIL